MAHSVEGIIAHDQRGTIFVEAAESQRHLLHSIDNSLMLHLLRQMAFLNVGARFTSPHTHIKEALTGSTPRGRRRLRE